jgi:putative transposase
MENHNRQSIRLRGWDYTQPGAYFITICTNQRARLFDNPAFRAVVENAWQNIPTHSHAAHVHLDEWVVMPNHLHGILMVYGDNDDGGDDGGRGEASRNAGHLQNNPQSDLPRPYVGPVELSHPKDATLKPGSIGAIVGNFKSLTARRINNLRRTPGGKVWQRGYYDRIIRNEGELDSIRRYIKDNPRRWAEDRDNLDRLITSMDYHTRE